MNLDAMVLRAMLRLARRRQDADEAELALRVGEGPHAIRAALRRLDGLGLVERRPRGAPRLTMGGLALALALLPKGSRAAQPAMRAPRAA
jgi:Mn-dependent DtxR family transcriptional regulator